jgi:uncharacterized membrane protein required for colicin V production
MESLSNFPVADGIVLIILTGFFLRSFFNGALKEIFSVVSLLAGFLAAANFGPLAQTWVVSWAGDTKWLAYAGYISLFIGVWFAVRMLGRLASNLAKHSLLGPWDRFGGGVIGVVKGVFIIATVVVSMDEFAPTIAPTAHEDERVMPYIRDVGGYIRNAATWERMEKIKEAVEAQVGPKSPTPEDQPNPENQKKNP